MSTKTIALETGVYEKLALRKRDGESFTKTISRLVEAEAASGTCEAAVHMAARIWKRPPAASEIEAMEEVIRDNRTDADWNVESPS